MESHITETLIELPYPFWITIILFAIISGLIQCIISFFIEKGKNLATKKDISDITNKIESVKDNYNKTLESYKIELQKEFEIHRYVVGLCHSLDNILLKHISSCLQSESRSPIGFYENDNKLLNENSKLSLFLSTYKYRYDSSSTLQQLRILSSEIDFNYKEREYISFEDGNNDLYHVIPNEKKEQLLKLLNEALMYFLPTIETKPEA